MEKKGTLEQKRRPKGDPNPQKGPLGDPGPLKGTHVGTVGGVNPYGQPDRKISVFFFDGFPRRVDTMKQFAPNDSDILALAKTSISVSMVSHLIPTSSS